MYLYTWALVEPVRRAMSSAAMSWDRRLPGEREDMIDAHARPIDQRTDGEPLG
jgi:hypothetical protein